MKRKSRFRERAGSLLICMLMLCSLFLSGCSGGSSTYSGTEGYSSSGSSYKADSFSVNDAISVAGSGFAMAGNGVMSDYDAPVVAESQAESSAPVTKKLVKTARMSGETKDYDNFMSWLSLQVNSLNGYVENMNEDTSRHYSSRLYYADYNSYDWYEDDADDGYYMTRYANMTVRIPADSLDAFMNLVGAQCNVTSRSSSVEDITLTYVDVESRIKALETQREKIMEFMETAEDMADLITLESRLSEINWQLDSAMSQRNVMDNQVDYATLSLYVDEVLDFTDMSGLPKSYGERLAAAFTKGLRDIKYDLISLSFWLAENIVKLLIWAVIIFYALKQYKKYKAKHPKAANERLKRGSVQAAAKNAARIEKQDDAASGEPDGNSAGASVRLEKGDSDSE